MTRTPDRAGRAPSGPAARGSASPSADPAGTPQPPVGVPAQTSGQAQAPKLPAPDRTRTSSRATPRNQASRDGTREEVPQSPAGGELPSNSPPAGSTGRTYTIALPAGLELLSLNDRLHWRERHRRSQAIKFAAYVTAQQAKVPLLGRVRVVVEYQPPDRRHRDADNPMAASKAAVDGIVMAGCLKDDECPRYVTGIWATIGPVYPKGRLVLHLTEVAP